MCYRGNLTWILKANVLIKLALYFWDSKNMFVGLLAVLRNNLDRGLRLKNNVFW